MFKLIRRSHSKHLPSNHKKLIYLLVFLFTLHATPAIYVVSTYLEQFIKPVYIGLLYAIASAITVVIFIFYRKILTRFGNFRALMVLLYLTLITLIFLTLSSNPIVVIIAFITNFVLTALFFMNMDIFLESETSDADTGGTRGLYLTALNTAFVAGPLASGYLLGDGQYWRVFGLGAIILSVVIIIAHFKLSYFKDKTYPKIALWQAFKKIVDERDIYFALQCGFALRVFFAWMIIYSPIYLTQSVGFSLEQTSYIIAVGLIPFVLLEAMLGKIADKKLGEKEILITGMLIAGISSGVIFFLPQNPNIIFWMGIFFATRVGASMIEVMTETYIFKKIDSSDISTLTFLRIIRPIAYVIAPLLGSVIIYALGIRWLFLILGVYLILTSNYAFRMKDTL